MFPGLLIVILFHWRYDGFGFCKDLLKRYSSCGIEFLLETVMAALFLNNIEIEALTSACWVLLFIEFTDFLLGVFFWWLFLGKADVF